MEEFSEILKMGNALMDNLDKQIAQLNAARNLLPDAERMLLDKTLAEIKENKRKYDEQCQLISQIGNSSAQ